MSIRVFEPLAFGPSVDRLEAALAARGAGLTAARLTQDFGAESAGHAMLVERLFGPQPSPRSDPTFRRGLEERLLGALADLPQETPRSAAMASSLIRLAHDWLPTGSLRPLLLGASSLALGTLLLFRPSAISGELAAPPTAQVATAAPHGGPPVTFTPEARATQATRRARQASQGGGSAGG